MGKYHTHSETGRVGNKGKRKGNKQSKRAKRRSKAIGKARSYSGYNKKRLTPAEDAFHSILKKIVNPLNLRYDTQYIFVPNYSKPDKFFILDFYIYPPVNLVVEIDGGYHNDEQQAGYDQWRQSIIEDHGAKVVRYTNFQVCSDTNNVKDNITSEIESALHSKLGIKLQTFDWNIGKSYQNGTHKSKKHKNKQYNKPYPYPSPNREDSIQFPKAFTNEASLKDWLSNNIDLYKSPRQTTDVVA